MSTWKWYLAAAAVVMTACAPEQPTTEHPAEATTTPPEAVATAPVPAGATPTLDVRLQAPDSETEAVQSWLRQRYSGFDDIHFFHAGVDLNGDGQREIVVYAYGPMLCGTGGCDTVVLEPAGDGFRVVSEISVTRPPVRVLPGTTNGWHDLLVRVSGGGLPEGYDAELRFDGTTYPDNPTVPPAEPATDTEGAQTLIPEYSDFAEGTPVPTE